MVNPADETPTRVEFDSVKRKAEDGHDRLSRIEADLPKIRAELDALKPKPVDTRSRIILCAAINCEVETPSHVDYQSETFKLTRIPLCPEHEATWRNEQQMLEIDPTRIRHFLVLGGEPGIEARLKAEVDALKENLPSISEFKRQTTILRESVALQGTKIDQLEVKLKER